MLQTKYVKTTKDFDFMPKGSVLEVFNEDESNYYGEWRSMLGTFCVHVPKNMCEIHADSK